MGTRSNIIAINTKGIWQRIYCHWDGYPEHNGVILRDNYTDPAKIAALLALGDLSILGPEIGVKQDFENPAPGMCLAYGRDRGEKGTKALKGASLIGVWPDGDTGAEYVYVWDGQTWLVGDPDKDTQSLVDLAALLRGEVKIAPAIKAFGGNFVIGKHSGDLDQVMIDANTKGLI